MRKILTIIIALVFIFSLEGCTGTDKLANFKVSSPEQKTYKVSLDQFQDLMESKFSFLYDGNVFDKYDVEGFENFYVMQLKHGFTLRVKTNKNKSRIYQLDLVVDAVKMDDKKYNYLRKFMDKFIANYDKKSNSTDIVGVMLDDFDKNYESYLNGNSIENYGIGIGHYQMYELHVGPDPADSSKSDVFLRFKPSKFSNQIEYDAS